MEDHVPRHAQMGAWVLINDRWYNRRSHLAGPLGKAFLKRFYELGWAVRDPDSRLVSFSPSGEQGFDGLFG